ncbi:hypothetical protein BASA81_008586 [Batrachochytrium salamandrivorans]|nr:hypothetical protein BASA81_008586 [Batrachochytrium salamandrivorans]
MPPKQAVVFWVVVLLVGWNLFASNTLVSNNSIPPPHAATSIVVPYNYFNFDPSKRYFFYQPSGGFGNQRYIIRWAIVAANALNRTLVVSPLAPHSNMWHGYNEWSKQDLVPANLVLDEFVLAQAVTRGVQFIDDLPMRVVAKLANTSAPMSIRVHVKGKWVDRRTKTKLLVYREADIRSMFLHTHNESVLFWDKMSMWGCCMTDSGRDLAWYGRHIVFSRALKLLARQLMPVLQYNAVHIRRGDMTSRDRATAQLYYKNYRLDKFSTKLPLYIASNEQDREWFQYLEEKFPKVVYFSDLLANHPKLVAVLDSFPSKMRNDVAGFIEILICGNAKHWQGSRRSTFSAAMRSVRTNKAARELEYKFDVKPSLVSSTKRDNNNTVVQDAEEEEEEQDDLLAQSNGDDEQDEEEEEMVD